ncbi:ABC transporter permease [Dactylosporangium sp. NPDC000244]|uniref:ABC transporter permease n=1 Tax=Dactylosporangium sp. NPDC000244 TaxID=3154365 RepID=UPI003321DB12|nr:ABC transporter permease [Dactylosporangium thailandense]
MTQVTELAPPDARLVRREASASPERAAGRRRNRRIAEIVLGFGAPIVLFVVWQIAATSGAINPLFFPAPTKVWDAALELIKSGELFQHLWVSLTRVLIGCGMGVVTGVAAGVALGASRWVRATLEPLLSALYTVPKLAVFPLLLLIFGLTDTALNVAIGMTVFFFMWVSTMTAFLAVSPGHREVAQSFDAGPWQTFRHVMFPAALPQMFIGLRMSVSVAVLMMVGVEFTQANKGIGYLIWYSWTLFQAPRMYVGIVAVALMGLLLSNIVKWVSLLVLPWARVEIEGGDRNLL